MQTVQLLKALDSCKKLCRVHRYFHISCAVREEQKRPKKKVRETTELIRLLDNTEKVLGIKPKTDAEKLARKQNMMLQQVEIQKFGTTYPVYKLVTSSEILGKDVVEKSVSSSKDIKKISFNNRITDHDLVTKLKMIRKMLAKNCEVHVAVAGNSDAIHLMEGVYQKIHEQLQDESRFLDKRIKEGALKFIIIPPKKNKEPQS